MFILYFITKYKNSFN